MWRSQAMPGRRKRRSLGLPGREGPSTACWGLPEAGAGRHSRSEATAAALGDAVTRRFCRRRCRAHPALPNTHLPCCCSWMVLFLFGHMRDFYRKKIWGGRAVKKGREGYAPIRQDYEVSGGV